MKKLLLILTLVVFALATVTPQVEAASKKENSSVQAKTKKTKKSAKKGKKGKKGKQGKKSKKAEKKAAKKVKKKASAK